MQQAYPALARRKLGGEEPSVEGMMGQARVALMMLGLVAAVAPAQAQDQPPPPPPPSTQPAPPPPPPTAGQPQEPREDLGLLGPIVFNIGGMLNVPVGATSDRTNLGAGLTAGVTFNPHRNFGAQLEYGAAWSDLKTGGQVANLGVFGTGFFQYFNLNAVVRPTRTWNRVGFYLIGGGGLYYRRASINRVNGTTAAAYCDPYLFYCYATPVSTATILGSRDSWDWGVDGGLGLTFAVTPFSRVYLEARFHYIWGPTFTAPNGQQRTANGEYVPIVLGFQF
jgi:hypothetical protein